MAALMLAKGRGARMLIGVDVQPERVETARALGLLEHGLVAGPDTLAAIEAATRGGASVAIDCSGNPRGRLLALQATRTWGRCVYIGETGAVQFDVSDDLLHRQRTIYGSWVTSVHNMDQCCEDLEAWGLHPHDIITDSFALKDAAQAYALMAGGRSGKVVIEFAD
jgi:threonine dehydrogenase-like Zn-dependent dehydrogenase